MRLRLAVPAILATMMMVGCSTHGVELGGESSEEELRKKKDSGAGDAKSDATDASAETFSCPELIPPPPGFCPDGKTPTAKKDSKGCITGFVCELCATLSPPSPTGCPGGKWKPRKDPDGCITGYDCVTCPELVPPSPTFCPDGKKVPIVNPDSGCTVGFDCVLPDGAACSVGDKCETGSACCYPCGIPGCKDKCMKTTPAGKCPMFI